MVVSDEERLKLQVEAWKTTVAVQEHFNDIELKIRGLAITVLTAVLAAAAVALRDGTKISVLGAHINLGAAIFFIGLVAWLLFYFVDQIWYHRLLIGAVKQGEHLEGLLEASVPGIGLTRKISEESPYKGTVFFGKGHFELHSSDKLKFFYLVVALLLLALTLATGVGGLASSKPTPSTTWSTSTTSVTSARR